MKQGPCKWCGSGGMCCSQNQQRNDTSMGCDGSFVGQTLPTCVLDHMGEFFCHSWKIQVPCNEIYKLDMKYFTRNFMYQKYTYI